MDQNMRLYIVTSGDEEGHDRVVYRSANAEKAVEKAQSFDLPQYHWLELKTYKLAGDGEWVEAESHDAGFSYISRAFDLDGIEDMDFDDPMDGDHASALASAGFGTDEDYGSFGGDEW